MEMPTTQAEFEALHERCFGCGDPGLYPWQISSLAQAGINHHLCGNCYDAINGVPSSRIRLHVIARLVETCVILALADAKGVAP